MLIHGRKYIFQFVTAKDGTRSEPFICDIIALKSMISNDMTEEEALGQYILVLADVALEIKPQDFVSRFPLYQANHFVELTFTGDITNA